MVDYKNNINRNNILQCLESRIAGYVKLIDLNWTNGNKEEATKYMKQIQAILDFIDGKKLKN